MHSALQQKLFDSYPDLFTNKDLGIQASCMAWGIDCGDGWYEIIDRMCHKLSKLGGVRFDQIKEKFGILTVYQSAPNSVYDESDRIIREAEKESSTTCEYCGKPGKANDTGWITTLCEECRQKK